MSASPVAPAGDPAQPLFAAFEQAFDAVVIAGADNEIRYFNAAAERLWGYRRSEVIGEQLTSLIPGTAIDGRRDLNIRRKDGSEAWGALSISRIGHPGEDLSICFVREVAEKADRDKTGEARHHGAALADAIESKQIHLLRYRALENLANDMPVLDVMDDLCRCVEAIAPDIVSSVLHVDRQGHLRALGGPSLPPGLLQAIDGLFIGPEVGSCGAAAYLGEPVLVTDISADMRWQSYKSWPLQAGLSACWSTPIKGRDGRVIGTVAFYFRECCGPSLWHQSIVDVCVRIGALVIEREEARQEVARLADYDALTGLPNRTSMRKLTEGIIANCPADGHVALMFLDLDHFKDVNETLGHAFGDQLLVAVTQRLLHTIRPGDILGRQGGDEFILVMPDCTAGEASRVASRITAALSEPLQLGVTQVATSASAGISMFPDNADDLDSLLKYADSAMYKAKYAGRSTHRFFSSEMDRVNEERRGLSTALRHAITHGGLGLHYQPQVRADDRLHGVEALARWHDPVRGDVPPSKFIPLAEEYGLIEQIGIWSLREACRQMSIWRQTGLDVPCVSVNLSPINFQNAGLPTLICGILAENGLSPDMLILEVTEGVVMSEHATAIDTMERIRKSGVRLSMDDFGTGYSSLSRLAHLPIRELKIDRSFMNNIESEASALAIARAIVRVGQSLDMTVVAEGVETEGQRRLLNALGCDVIQGFVYSPALAEPDFVRWLAGYPVPQQMAAAPSQNMNKLS